MELALYKELNSMEIYKVNTQLDINKHLMLSRLRPTFQEYEYFTLLITKYEIRKFFGKYRQKHIVS